MRKERLSIANDTTVRGYHFFKISWALTVSTDFTAVSVLGEMSRVVSFADIWQRRPKPSFGCLRALHLYRRIADLARVL